MAVEYIEYESPAEGTRAGLVINRPKDLVAGKKYPLIIFHHGIGERGDGSDIKLDKLRMNGSVDGLEKGAKDYEFILIEPQTSMNWQYEETNEAYQWAQDNLKDNINWNKVYITGLSLGGGGSQRYLSVTPDAHKKFAAAVINCPGPNQYFILDKNYPVIANTKVPIWYFHNIGDNVVAPAQSTLLTDKKIKELKGTAQYKITLYHLTGHTWPSYNRSKGQTAVTNLEADLFNKPSCNIYEWMLMNEIGKPAVMPPSVEAEPAPKPVPTPAPVPEPAPTPKPVDTPTTTPAQPASTPVLVSGVWSEGVGKRDALAIVFFADGTKVTYKAATGDILTGVWTSLTKGTMNVSLSFKTGQPIYIKHK